MALYRFQTSSVSRGKGDGAIKRAAYNARCKLTDDRTGQVWNYAKRKGLECAAIFAPDNSPEWARDRQKLWNEAARAEDKSTRRDTAREARDFKVSLPHELNAEQREWLMKDFGRYLMRKGMVVDMAIHSPDPHSDSRHYHAHILTTTREITGDGFGAKNRTWNKAEELQKWRERFADLGAKQLERAGYKLEAERYREAFGSLAVQRVKAIARGDMQHADALDREPTRPLGPHAAAMERNGIRTVRGNQNSKIREINEGRGKQPSKSRPDAHPQKAKEVDIRSAGRNVAGKAGKALEGALDAISAGIESLIVPVLSPQQKRDAAIEIMLREADAKEARERGRER